jgi:hypothetical protein
MLRLTLRFVYVIFTRRSPRGAYSDSAHCDRQAVFRVLQRVALGRECPPTARCGENKTESPIIPAFLSPATLAPSLPGIIHNDGVVP